MFGCSNTWTKWTPGVIGDADDDDIQIFVERKYSIAVEQVMIINNLQLITATGLKRELDQLT